jgi:Zn finger protein HypA/HybF involved in hydrogenase expression
MHELGIALDIYHACREAVRGHGPGRIERVKVAVGELAALEPDLIAFAWQAVTTDGPDAGSVLEAQWCPAEQHCPQCGESKPRFDGSWLRLCPDCGHALTVSGGTQIEVLELTYQTDDEEANTP